ncbi:lipopolysaccharide kinase InaA family protein [Mesocricetibacter intestinalis]|nr:protein kinase family protein [Mesocricetibacter intestinalis]
MPFEYEGQKYWLKQPEKLKGIWRILKAHPQQHFAEETAILRRLNEQGAAVPELVLFGKDFFVVKDVGRTLNSWIEDKSLSEQCKAEILADSAAALNSLHERGFIHGRPALRDIAWHKGKVSFMDFECHSRRENMEWQKIRDGLVYLHSLCRSKHLSDAQVLGAIESYRSFCPPELWGKMLDLLRRYRCVYYLLLPFKPIARMDLIALYRLFELMFINKDKKS